MTTLRQAHKSKFTVIDNALAQNNVLSLRARGLMVYLLSLPDDWKIHLTHLCTVLKEGEQQLKTILKELKDMGYIHHHKMGFSEGWQYFVFESPVDEEEFKKYLRTSPFLQLFEKANCSKTDPLQSTNSSLQKKKKNTKDESLPFVLLSPEDYKALEDTYGASDLTWMMEYLSSYKIKNPHKRRNNDRDAIERWVWQALDQHKGKVTFDEQKSKEIKQRKEWAENNQWTGTGGCGVATEHGFEEVSGSISNFYAYDKNNKFWTVRGI